jgi:penicillin-binding protein 1A
MIEKLTPTKSVEFLKELGISTLDDTLDANLSLSLGGLTNGITSLEMAGAYATIANDGVYQTPIFYTKIENQSGEVILTPAQEKRQVMTASQAYIVKSILTAPVIGRTGAATATRAAMSGFDVSAKTGTSNDAIDKSLCGFTDYYTAACWYGFDIKESIPRCLSKQRYCNMDKYYERRS